MALVEIQIRSGFYRTGDQLGASHFCSDGLRGLFIAPGGPLGVTDRLTGVVGGVMKARAVGPGATQPVTPAIADILVTPQTPPHSWRRSRA